MSLPQIDTLQNCSKQEYKYYNIGYWLQRLGLTEKVIKSGQCQRQHNIAVPKHDTQSRQMGKSEYNGAF